MTGAGATGTRATYITYIYIYIIKSMGFLVPSAASNVPLELNSAAKVKKLQRLRQRKRERERKRGRRVLCCEEMRLRERANRENTSPFACLVVRSGIFPLATSRVICKLNGPGFLSFLHSRDQRSLVSLAQIVFFSL